jgi:high mobility group protein B2
MKDHTKSKSRGQIAKSAKSSNASPMTTPRKGKGKRASEESKGIEVDEENARPAIMPKRPSTGYVFFASEKQRSGAYGNLKVTERMKKAGEEWKLMVDKDKAKYLKMAEDDVKRFEKETKEQEEKGYFINQDGVKSTDLKVDLKKFSIHTVFPKKASTGMTFYIKENYNKNREAHPDLGLGEMGKINAQLWNDMPTKQKAKYEKLAADDKERYAKEIDQLQTLGYFINSEGIKSTELKKKYNKQERIKLQKEKDIEKEKNQ